MTQGPISTENASAEQSYTARWVGVRLESQPRSTVVRVVLEGDSSLSAEELRQISAVAEEHGRVLSGIDAQAYGEPHWYDDHMTPCAELVLWFEWKQRP